MKSSTLLAAAAATLLMSTAQAAPVTVDFSTFDATQPNGTQKYNAFNEFTQEGVKLAMNRTSGASYIGTADQIMTTANNLANAPGFDTKFLYLDGGANAAIAPGFTMTTPSGRLFSMLSMDIAEGPGGTLANVKRWAKTVAFSAEQYNLATDGFDIVGGVLALDWLGTVVATAPNAAQTFGSTAFAGLTNLRSIQFSGAGAFTANTNWFSVDNITVDVGMTVEELIAANNVPEPSALALVGAALMALSLTRRRRRTGGAAA